MSGPIGGARQKAGKHGELLAVQISCAAIIFYGPNTMLLSVKAVHF